MHIFFAYYYRLFQIYYCDSGATELDMLIAIGFHSGEGVDILSEALSKYSVSCAVEYSHTFSIKLNSIVEEICYCLSRLVNTHSAHIYIRRK